MLRRTALQARRWCSNIPKLLDPSEIDHRKYEKNNKKSTGEALQAVYLLKKFRNDPDKVMASSISRMVRLDLINTLELLKTLDEVDLALRVFNHIRKEPWYIPSRNYFQSMIFFVGKHKRFNEFKMLLEELKKEGLEPDKHMFAMPMKDCIQQDDFENCMKFYEMMKEFLDKGEGFFYRALVSKLEKKQEFEKSEVVKKDLKEYTRLHRGSAQALEFVDEYQF